MAQQETGQRREKKKIGDILLDAGLINPEQLKQALQKQSVTGKRIGNILVEMGAVSEENMVGALSKQLGFPSVDLKKLKASEALLKLFPPAFLLKHQIAPVGKEGKRLKIAMSNPLDRSTLNDIEFMTGSPVDPVVASSSAMEFFLKNHVEKEPVKLTKETSAERVEILEEETEKTDVLKLKNAAESDAVIRTVNRILAEAIRSNTASIHIKPRQNDALIRFRIDGMVRNISTISLDRFPAVVARLKMIGRMDIAVDRRPQNGSARLKIGEREVELSLSSLPTVYGEKIVIRIMEKIQDIRSLENLGMHPKDLSHYYALLSRPHGIILYVGPVGSGNTTTMYTTLRYLRSDENSIVTIEDPVEFHIPGINQVQVDPRENITFLSGLRSVLFQDPDIIMVSEIRDSETAELVFQSSLRGHMVLTSFYSNQAVSALTFLLDLGITPHMLATAVGGVVSQRLVRRNCTHCLEKYIPEPRVLAGLKIDVMEISKMRFYHGRGCPKCSGTGYNGQIGIFEILTVDPMIKERILHRASEGEILDAARKKGMTTMEENGLYLVLNKITTLEEILRTVPPEVIHTQREEDWEKQIISAFDDALYIL
jgi:type IV pilus assembly protein PilB